MQRTVLTSRRSVLLVCNARASSVWQGPQLYHRCVRTSNVASISTSSVLVFEKSPWKGSNVILISDRLVDCFWLAGYCHLSFISYWNNDPGASYSELCRLRPQAMASNASDVGMSSGCSPSEYPCQQLLTQN